MTTATSRPVLGPALVSAAGGVLLTVVGALISGAGAAMGAAMGATVVVTVFAFGAAAVGLVARAVPSLSLVLALLTYTLQVVVVTAVFAGLARAGAFDAGIAREWLAAAVIGSTLVWTAAQLVDHVRARVLLYDLPSHRTEASVR